MLCFTEYSLKGISYRLYFNTDMFILAMKDIVYIYIYIYIHVMPLKASSAIKKQPFTKISVFCFRIVKEKKHVKHENKK